MTFFKVGLVGRGTLALATLSSHQGTLLRPKIWFLSWLRLSRLSTQSCRSLSPSEEAVELEEVEVVDAEVVAVMEEEVGVGVDGECVAVL